MKGPTTIPKSSERILKWICKEEYIEEIIGDLHEYHDELKSKARWQRGFLFWFHVLNFIKPWSIKSFEGSVHLNQYGMLKNIFISALRSIKRQKLYSTINIFGLSLGISIALMLFIFISHELHHDSFHVNGNRTYKVISNMTTNKGNDWVTGITFGSVVPEVKKHVPEVEMATRIFDSGNLDVVKNKNSFQNQHLYYADYEFFKIFSFPSVYGSAFNKPSFDNHGVVISQELASLLFNDVIPIGQTLKFNESIYTILDVVEVPDQSHLQFDMIISLEGMKDLNEWSYDGGLEFHSYLLYKEHVKHQEVSAKVNKLYNDQVNDRFQDFVASADNYVMPFRDVYLKSEGISNNLAKGSIQTIYVLGALNILILLIVVVNYINLTTAQYEKRIKEIGVRKVLGANRKMLIFQFLGESVLITLLSFVLALILIQLGIERFGQLMQIPATITFWQEPIQLLTILFFAIVLGLLSGIYPALFISNFNPIKILKRDFFGIKKEIKGGKILVTFQFVIAIILIINLVFLNKQISFAKNKELGFSKDQVLVVNNLTDAHKEQYESLVSDISNYPDVLEITGAQSALGNGASGQTIILEGESPSTAQSISEIRTMHNFINTYDIQIIKGRDFNTEMVTDGDAFILNEAGESMLFPDGGDPIDKIVQIAGRKGPIIGIVKDFHFGSLKRELNPLVLSMDEPYRITLSIKLRLSDTQELLNNIEKVLQKADPNYRLGYYFLDDHFNKMFEAEERNATLITYASMVAALISLIGLVSLISHSLAKRVKEIAIRKVLGARFNELLWVLAKEFFSVILISNIIAIPIALVSMDRWLESFAYRIKPGDNWELFIMVGVLSFIITFGLILIQYMQRMKARPAEILSNE